MNEEKVAGGVLGGIVALAGAGIKGATSVLHGNGGNKSNGGGNKDSGNSGTWGVNDSTPEQNPLNKGGIFNKANTGSQFQTITTQKGPTGALATANKVAPYANKIGGAFGTVAGMAVAAPLGVLNPRLGSAAGQATKGITQKAITSLTTGSILGGSVIKNTAGNVKQNWGQLQDQGAGSVFKWAGTQLQSGIKEAATVSIPNNKDGGLFPGLDTQKLAPRSTGQALAGMAGVVFNTQESPVEGYKKGQQVGQHISDIGNSISGMAKRNNPFTSGGTNKK